MLIGGHNRGHLLGSARTEIRTHLRDDGEFEGV